MEKATVIGIGGAMAVIVTSNMLEGGSPASLILFPPMLLVFGATLLVAFAGGTVADAKSSMLGAKRAFTTNVPPAAEVVPTVVGLADKARREGLLALEDATKDIDDKFLVKGVTLAIDGTDPDEVRDILEGEVDAKRRNDKTASKFFSDAGGYAPTIGIIGTVMSLVHVLENLADPESLGHSIAGAFLATLWGVMTANVMWLPIAAKMKRISELEIGRMEVIIEGVAAIQAGSNPRVVEHKLVALLPAGQRAEAA